MDIVFLLDSSRNAGEQGYQAQRDFASLFSSKLAVSSSGSRVGVISYSLQARLDVKFEDYYNSAGPRSVLTDLKFLGGSPRIEAAFHMAFVELFTAQGGARPGVARVMVLLTAGMVSNITDYETLRFAVEPFKGEGIAVIAVGVGQTADLQRLRVLVDSDEMILAVPSFQGLSDLSVDLTLLACKAAEPKRVIHPMDVAFLIDTSDGVSSASFEREKHFLKTLVRSVAFSSNRSRVSIISFGNESDLTVNFSEQQSTGSLIERVDSIPLLGGEPKMDKALKMAAAQLFSSTGSARTDLSRIVVIITDCERDNSSSQSKFDASAGMLQKEDVKIFVVAVGCESENNKKELEVLVDRADDSFTPDSFDKLAVAAAKLRSAAEEYAGLVWGLNKGSTKDGVGRHPEKA
ncbi:cochlin-like [Acropora palmata]|uniref:cochlin-like n=1 Tax=Acropora palmata TaxID=6131 RepID=UPI003DA0DA9A